MNPFHPGFGIYKSPRNFKKHVLCIMLCALLFDSVCKINVTSDLQHLWWFLCEASLQQQLQRVQGSRLGLPLLLHCCSILAPSFSLFPSLLHSVIEWFIDPLIHPFMSAIDALDQCAHSLANRPLLFLPLHSISFYSISLQSVYSALFHHFIPFSFRILVPNMWIYMTKSKY